MHPQREHRLVPVLLVGTADPELERRLWEHGIGVITTASVDRALHLLTNFTVPAVIYDAPAADRIPDLTAIGTRVIVLVDDDAEWNRPDVTTLRRTAPVASIAAAVQQCAAVQPSASHVGDGCNQLELARRSTSPGEGRIAG